MARAAVHCLVLDGVYRRIAGEPDFQKARAPNRDELKGVLDTIIARLVKLLTGKGYLIEEHATT
jgi:hypothetical protein